VPIILKNRHGYEQEFMKIMKKYWLIILTVPLMALLASCDDADKDADPADGPLAAVTVQTVKMKELQDTVSFVARVQAIDTYDVTTRVEGFIESKNFIDGHNVNAGDVLFEIEKATYENQIDLIKADIRGAEAAKKEAQKNYKRAKSLIKKGNISVTKLDEFEANEAKATANIDKFAASLRQAELQLSYTTISTPISGRIGQTKISVGNLVKPGSELLAQVISFDPIYVSIAVSENDLLEARRHGFKGDGEKAARIRLGDGKYYSHDGVIDFVDNKVDPTTDAITIRATFPNPDQILFPNQFVSMDIARSKIQQRILILQVAVQENQGGRFVLIINNENRVEVRSVELGREEGEYIVVKQGLEEGEDIIVQGLQKVRPGQEVTVEHLPDSEG
jgi:membrane fusion protein, multidrug efflux system